MLRGSYWFGLGSVLLLGLFGCGSSTSPGAAQEAEDDGENDTFLVDGKSDVAGIADGSAESCGVLSVCNDGTLEELDIAAGLTPSAAKNIVAYRAGADGVVGTADDGYFDSLKEVDDVKYVGPATFKKIAAYAKAQSRNCSQIDLNFLSISDLHGQLDPMNVANVGNVGGAAALSSYFTAERIANPRSMLLAAGDSFGASPPLAAFFDEKPIIEAMNLMKFDVEAPGNHSFDRGTMVLHWLIELSSYRYLSANLMGVASAMKCETQHLDLCIPPYLTYWKGGVKVAVIGLMTPELPTLVKPGSLGPITVVDPVAPAIASRNKAAKEGATVFVALAHIGGTPGVNGAAPTGPIVDLANKLQGFDLIIGGHTHAAINAKVGNVLVVENPSQGASYSRATLRYDFSTKSVVDKSAEAIVPLVDKVTPDQAIIDLLAPYRTEVSAKLDTKIGVATGIFERGNNVERLKEVPIGDLLADAVRAKYQTQIAVVNGGGIRSPIPSTYAPADFGLRRPATGYKAGPPYDLVMGDVFAVLPFANDAATCTVTGEQVWKLAEHGLSGLPAAKGQFPQISGFKITFDSSATAGARVKTIALEDGTAIPKTGGSYSLATSDFMYLGGDGYTMLVGAPGNIREKLTDSVAEYIKAAGTIKPEVKGRLVDVAAP